MGDKDPRVYFAAERTLLAWVRTGVAVIGLGFIVARFGLFLRVLDPSHPDVERIGFSGTLGSLLALFGGVVTALGAVQFLAFLRELSAEERPRARLGTILSVVMAAFVSAVGVGLGVYLVP